MKKQSQTSILPQQEPQKGFQPFYLFPLFYILSIYLLPILSIITAGSPIGSYLPVLPITSGILNIIAAAIFCKPENRIMMLNAAVLVKYAMIPFFLVGGITLAASFLLSFVPVPFMIFIAPMITAFGAVGGWLILALESPYTLSYLCLSSRANIRPTAMTILHAILQFFFTLDVIDVMILSFKEQRWKKLTITIIILLAVLLLLALLLIILGIVWMVFHLN